MDLADLQIFRTVARRAASCGRRASCIACSPTSRRASSSSRPRSACSCSIATASACTCRRAASCCSPTPIGCCSCPTKRATPSPAPRRAACCGSARSRARRRAGCRRCWRAYHAAYPDVRVELMTGTNDALTAAVAERRSRPRSSPKRRAAGSSRTQPLFRERLVVISARGHRPIARPQDVAGDSIIAFPNGCAYRRVLQRWLGTGGWRASRVLELASYHAIVACVASGTGIALVPESVLDTVRARRSGAAPAAQGARRSSDAADLARAGAVGGADGAARSGRAGRPQRSTRKGRLTFATECPK